MAGDLGDWLGSAGVGRNGSGGVGRGRRGDCGVRVYSYPATVGCSGVYRTTCLSISRTVCLSTVTPLNGRNQHTADRSEVDTHTSHTITDHHHRRQSARARIPAEDPASPTSTSLASSASAAAAIFSLSVRVVCASACVFGKLGFLKQMLLCGRTDGQCCINPISSGDVGERACLNRDRL